MLNEELQQALLRQLADAGSDVGPPAREDLGVLGRLFGARYASTNIAGFTVFVLLLLLLLMVGVGAFAKVSLPFERELVTGSFSGITLALGYLFGSRGRL
ncbi:MAG: hypothetical protein OXH75_27495 [Acidobacteria bacterium]|nr:hypothetical protein [Acidobacteriota bacterium]